MGQEITECSWAKSLQVHIDGKMSISAVTTLLLFYDDSTCICFSVDCPTRWQLGFGSGCHGDSTSRCV